ncbi:MAG: hypothetical protein GY750_08650 [Lentisphaerae bacterium]|nr:hypothetical protein [Lentisphaerota bacterium]MCP4101479.1 hypothetical protein [Lentisphaerota bacterium]
MRGALLLCCLAMAAVFVCGCGSIKRFDYPAEEHSAVQFSGKPLYDAEVAVIPFNDRRENKNNHSTILLYLVPLVPYGWMSYTRPEDYTGYVSIAAYYVLPNVALAKAAAYNLHKSNLFSKAYFSFSEQGVSADYILHADLKEMSYKGRIISYGLSFAAPLLWFLGLPEGTVENRFAVEYYLTRRGSRRRLWEFKYDKACDMLVSPYYNYGRDVDMFPVMLNQSMNEALVNLKKNLKSSGK